jgi:hypothetical protein
MAINSVILLSKFIKLSVARVAEQKLEKEHSEVLEKALEILSWLKPFTRLEVNHPFVECASFADEIKLTGFSHLSEWHYIDKPLFIDGF